MLTVARIDPERAADVLQFIAVPHQLYAADPNWVPPLDHDAALLLNRRRHPFYEHSEAAFFLARRGARTVGRIAALELVPYNRVRGVHHVSFAMFDCEDDHDAAEALFGRVFEWGRGRQLDRVVGPRGLGPLDGYGVLVDGFEQRQLMTMTGYNGPWYSRLIESQGFVREIDFVSYELRRATFVMPEAVRRAAKAATTLRIVRYSSKRALVRAARRLAETYNRAFADNWEHYPLTDREVEFLVQQVRPIVDHRLMAFIAAGEEVVGFVLAFPDISAALQRAGGRLSPLRALGLLIERTRTTSVALNGAGILPEYHRRGGNALLYMEIERAVRHGRFHRAELPQVAETATRMRRDLERLGAIPIKTHRVYSRPV